MKRLLAVIIVAIVALSCAVMPVLAADASEGGSCTDRAMTYKADKEYVVVVPEGIEMTTLEDTTALIKAQSLQIEWGQKLVVLVESENFHNLQSEDETKLVPYTIKRKNGDVVLSSAGGFALEVMSGVGSVTEDLNFFVADVGEQSGLYKDKLTFRVAMIDQ